MPKKNPRFTPNSQIKNALRMLFLRSRERSFAVKRDKNTCQACGVKNSRAKGREVYVEVHHLDGVTNWDKMFDVIRQELLVEPEGMTCLCKDCHKKEHAKDK